MDNNPLHCQSKYSYYYYKKSLLYKYRRDNLVLVGSDFINLFRGSLLHATLSIPLMLALSLALQVSHAFVQWWDAQGELRRPPLSDHPAGQGARHTGLHVPGHRLLHCAQRGAGARLGGPPWLGRNRIHYQGHGRVV